MFYFQQHCDVFCSSEQVRTVLPQFLLPLQNTINIILLEGQRSWEKVYEVQLAPVMKGLCRGLYNKDIAGSTVGLVPSCLKKIPKSFS